MINVIGVVGWGVGGLEGQAAMLGEPVTIQYPDVVGVRLAGRLRPGVGATDLALTELLRARGVVDKFVEFCGPGVGTLGRAERAAVSNMAPEYGATCVFFPYDDETAGYLRLSGREEEHIRLVDAYLTTQGLKRTHDRPEPSYDEIIDLDLAAVEPSMAGPDLPQQRLPLSQVPESYRRAAPPADRKPETDECAFGEPLPRGPVAIAAITSRTNTANPALMVQAGLLAERAVRAGLTAKPWVKTSLSPGSRVVEDYLKASGLLPALEKTGFHIVGFGCMTCIGNSGPLHPVMERLAGQDAVTPVAVLSGNRNFAGRVNPQTPCPTWPRPRWSSPTRWPARSCTTSTTSRWAPPPTATPCSSRTCGPRTRRPPHASPSTYAPRCSAPTPPACARAPTPGAVSTPRAASVSRGTPSPPTSAALRT